MRLGFIGAVTTLAWFSVSAAVVAICATLLVVLQGKAGTIIELSFGPLKAKLERNLGEAELLVHRLRDLAVLQAKSVLSTSIRTGRWSGKEDWLYHNMREIEASLRDLGVSEPALREARADVIRFVAFDLGHAAMGKVMVPSELGPEAVREWQAIMHKELEITPEDVEAFLRKWDRLTPDRLQRIEDMRWVLEHGDIRDIEQYRRSKDELRWAAPK